ncbi:MAG TPA: hypothetical protein PL183_11035, partial [Aquamicrobium sp.]|nr:hypothetical protein [Aquamicrobium sp.]
SMMSSARLVMARLSQDMAEDLAPSPPAFNPTAPAPEEAGETGNPPQYHHIEVQGEIRMMRSAGHAGARAPLTRRETPGPYRFGHMA